MRILAISLATVIAFVSCTKEQSKPISFDSPFKFVGVTFKDDKQFAEVNGEIITEEQIFQNSPGLAETRQLFYNHLFLESYKLTVETQNPEKSSLTKLTFYGPVREDWQKWFENLKVETLSSIEVNIQEPADNKIATIENKTYTKKDLVKRDLTLVKLERRLFEEKMRKLVGLSVRRVLMAESTKLDMPLATYVEKNIIGDIPAATDEDAEQFATEKGLSLKELDQNKGALRQQLKNIVTSNRHNEAMNEYVAKNLVKEPIKVSVEAPTNEVKMTTFGERIPSFGSGSISVTIFSNPVCEECQKVNELVKKWRQKPNFKVDYVFYMSQADRQARMVSEAAMCVYNKHRGEFWTYMDAYKSEGEKINEQLIYDTAKEVGVDSEQFKKCFLSREEKTTIDAQVDTFRNYGFRDYPVVLVNGKIFENVGDYTVVEEYIKEQRESASFFAKIVDWFKNLLG